MCIRERSFQMLDGLNNLTKNMNQGIKATTGAVKTVSRASRTAGKAVDLAERGVQQFTGTPAATQDPSQGHVQIASAPQGQTGNAVYEAPEGTCIILPPQVTANGQPRYLGAKAYESIKNLMTGDNGPNNNVVVVGPDGKPSQNVYTYNPDGTLCVRGTQTPVDIQQTSDGKLAGVILSEKEYFSAGYGIQQEQQNPGAQQIKQNAELGKAEDANNASWWEKNWQWLVGAGIAVAAAITGYFLIRNQKKKTKSANNQASELRSEIASLGERVSELQAGLAANGTQMDGSVNTGTTTAMMDNSR